jgi:MFS transporter, DHA1 family, tetracycline resistance protein
MKFKKEYVIIFLIQVTEVLGFSLVLPFLPLYAKDFGASPLIIGTILMTFSLFQFITSPILGRLSDSYGRKPLLIFSQISTFLSFIILGFSNALWMIFASRIVDGVLGSNHSIAQAYLSDISSKKNRSKVFGISGAAFGFGFLIGPAIGGYLATISPMGYKLPSFIAAGISLVTILLTATLLKETIKKKKTVKLSLNIFHFEELRKYILMPKIRLDLWQYFAYLVSHIIFTSQFALFSNMQLGFEAQDIGFLMAYVGAISIIIRGFLLSFLIDVIGETKLMYIGMTTMIIGLIGAMFVNNWIEMGLIITCFAFGSGVNRPILIGQISRKVSEKEQGAVLGVANSLGSLAQIIGPLVGGLVLTYFFTGSLPLISAIAMFIGLVARINTGTKNINTKTP